MNGHSAPSLEGEAWPVIDLCLRLHAEQFRDLYVRWQQIEAKANAVIAGAGIVLAALAVLLQVRGTAAGASSAWICVGGLLTTGAIACAVWSQRVEGFRPPPSSSQMQRILINWCDLPGERDPARVLNELAPVWDGAIEDLERKLPRKSTWVARAQVALGCGALSFLVALVVVSRLGE